MSRDKLEKSLCKVTNCSSYSSLDCSYDSSGCLSSSWKYRDWMKDNNNSVTSNVWYKHIQHIY